MTATPRLTISDHERAALAQLTSFPLLAAVYGRRSRRFPVGGEVPAGPLAYRSTKPAQPLSEVERALVLATVTGVTGWHFGITHHPGYAPAMPNYAGSAAGRTFPSAAGFHTSEFFFTDDSGTYFLPTRDATPDVPVVDGQVDLDAWLEATVARYRRLSDHRHPHPARGALPRGAQHVDRQRPRLPAGRPRGRPRAAPPRQPRLLRAERLRHLRRRPRPPHPRYRALRAPPARRRAVPAERSSSSTPSPRRRPS